MGSPTTRSRSESGPLVARNGRRALVAAALVLASLSRGTVARANGRYPLAGQFVVSPVEPDLLALRATFGILVSHDAGKAWDWICEPAVGYSDINEDPSIGWTSSAALVGMFEGMAVSPDEGCSWSTKIAGPITDLVVRRDDPHSALALTTAYQSTDDAGDFLYASSLYMTSDDGAHWTQLTGSIDPLTIPETVDVSSDGGTIYISGYQFVGTSRIGVFLRSTDHGATYVKSTIVLAPMEVAPFIGAVDPKNPLRVYVRMSTSPAGSGVDDAALTPDRLAVTDDGGQSFRTVFTSAGPLMGFALSPDGSKVYVGGPVDGVEVATSASLSFAQKAHLPVYCLGAAGTSLYACSDDAVAFLLGTSNDDGATFSPLLRRNCLRGPLSCPASTSAAQCPALYGALASSDIGTGGPSCGDGGGAGADAASGGSGSAAPGSSAAPPAHARCDCGTTPGAGSGLGAGAVAALVGIIRRRGRRRAAPKARQGGVARASADPTIATVKRSRSRTPRPPS